MSGNDLDAAVRALRTRFAGSSSVSQASEDAIVARLGERRRKRARLGWLLPIAAVLAVSSAWANSEQLRAGLRWLSGGTRTTVATTAPRAQRALPKEVAARAAPIASSAPAPKLDPPRAPSRARAHVRSPAPDLANDADALYAEAHHLHFVEQNPARALLAWDRYLSAAPAGEFALEARYNRAVCLVRLGRNEQALSALEPFARGDYGPYRRADAQSLIREIERRAQSLPNTSK
jgi:tetratricopeptide (TPR) repeat protein